MGTSFMLFFELNPRKHWPGDDTDPLRDDGQGILPD